MASFVRLKWVYEDLGFSAKARRRECEYYAYVPDPLVGRRFVFSGECAADIAEAEAAIRSMDVAAPILTGGETLTRLLLRAEAAASSRIESIMIGADRLLRAEVARESGMTGPADTAAESVLGNIDAMTEALLLAEQEPEITADTIVRIHERLARGTGMDEYAGRLRKGASWIGGSLVGPCAAAYVPPPSAEVPRLLADVAAFCNDTSLSPVAQAAIAHAQFETIHPFADGNGRTGRALIHLILRRRGLARCWCVPVSLVLATLQRDYFAGLAAFRYDGPAESAEAAQGVDEWVSMFSRACTMASHDADLFQQRVDEIRADWRRRLEPVRRDSAVDLLIDLLPQMPVVTVNEAARRLGRSFRAANLAIDQLVRAKVLRQVSMGRRNRAFEASEIVDAFTGLERRLGSPAGDTRIASPVRPVPWRARHWFERA